MEKSENKNVLEIDKILDTLRNSDGSISEIKLKDFIQDTLKLRKNSSEVNSRITKGLLSGFQYPSDTVLSVYENLQKNLIDKFKICEDMLCLVQDEHTKHLVLEYFGKLY